MENSLRENVQIRNFPEDEKPREKLFTLGAERLSNTELIAIILGSGRQGVSALSLAEQLLTMDSSGISYFGACRPEEYLKIKGVGAAKAAKLAAAVELGKRMSARKDDVRRKVCCSSDVADLLMQEMRYLDHEVFKVLLLNVKNEVISIDDVAVGGLNSAYVSPREAFAGAVRRGAASVILVHNHPSGNPSPSDSDILLTERLQEAGKLMGISVMDHIVIGGGGYVSIVSEHMQEDSPD